MNEANVRKYLRALGIMNLETSNTGWVRSKCPLALWLHTGGTDKHPSFGIKIADGNVSGYKCYTCGSQGRVSGLIRKFSKFRDEDDLHELSINADQDDLEGMTAPDFEAITAFNKAEPLVEEVYDGFYIPVEQHKQATAYVEGRNISLETCRKLGLLFDEDTQRILFPVRGQQGELYGFTGRAISPLNEPKIKDYFGLRKNQLILGQHLWVNNKPVLLIEGLFGYAHLHELGLDKWLNIGAVMGSQLHGVQIEKVVCHESQKCYLLFDNDEAGDKGIFGAFEDTARTRRDTTHSAYYNLKKYIEVYIPLWPDNKSDPDELTLEDLCKMFNIKI